MTWEQQLAANRRKTAELKRATRERLNRTRTVAGLPLLAPYIGKGRGLTRAEVVELLAQRGYPDPFKTKPAPVRFERR